MAAVAAADFADAPKSQISKSIDCGEKKLACSLSIKQQARPPHVKNRAKMGKGGRHSSMMSRIRVGFTDDIRGCGMTIQVATRLRPLLLNPRANSKKVYYNYYTYCNPNSASNHIWI